MKQALQLKIGQSLTMTPQLQQAIKLLQMSTLDLQQEITRTLEENPLLEREDEIEQYAESSDSDVREQETPIESVEVAVETEGARRPPCPAGAARARRERDPARRGRA